MIDNNVFADKIEGIINQIFSNLVNRNFHGLEYSILYNSKKHTTWLIVFFFKEMKELKIALEDGTCYAMHNFLQVFFDEESKFETIKRLISFEQGPRPISISENENLFDRLTNTLQALLKAPGDKNQSTCISCGHNSDNHELRCIRDEGDTPSEGWSVCPVENCTCFSTWNINYEVT